MKPNDLKTRVLSILSANKFTVRQVMEELNQNSTKKYAYTTIGTILTRLETEGTIKSINISQNNRKQKLYSIKKDAHKNEVRQMLRGLLLKFGPLGIRHLGEVLERDLDETDVEIIRKKLNL